MSMKTCLKLVPLSAVISLFLVFFFNQTLKNPWTQVTREARQKEKPAKTSKNGHALDFCFKRKDLSSTNNASKPQSGERDDRKKRYQPQQTFPVRKNLIILSPGRGGSTFLGSLFDCNPHVMYFFEPLYTVANKMSKVNLRRGDKEPKNYKGASIKVIDSFLQCDFSNISDSTLASFLSGFHRRKSKALSKKNLPRISNKLLSEACNNYNHTVLKILSGRLHNGTIKTFKELFQQQNRYEIKLVHLVRDPRAVVFSRVKLLGWMRDHLHPSFHEEVQKICDPILQNIRLGLLSPPPWLKNRFKVIRYEDLALNTLNVAQELYRFAGFDWSASVHEFISALKKHTKQGDVYSVCRNASVAVSRWKTASEPFIRAVENICGDLMDFLGYEKWKKQDQ